MQGMKEMEPPVKEMEKDEEVQSSLHCPVTVKRTLTSTGTRISARAEDEQHQRSEWIPDSDSKTRLENRPSKKELTLESSNAQVGDVGIGKLVVKQEPLELWVDEKSVKAEKMSTDSVGKMTFDDFLKATDTKVMSKEEALKLKSDEPVEPSGTCEKKVKLEPEKDRWQMPYVKPNLKEPEGYPAEGHLSREMKKEEFNRGVVIDATPLNWVRPALPPEGHGSGFRQLHQKPPSVKNKPVENRSLSCPIEDGDFPVEPDWFLVGGEVVNGLSTTKGMKIMDNEIVHFKFSTITSSKNNTQWILRFETKRHGEIGRLPMEWAKCVIPLLNSTKVKIFGRCVAAPENLQMMQEIMLYVSFYVHRSIFTVGDMSWRLDGPSYIDSTTYPMLTLFKLLKIKPYQKAEFTPEELASRKRLLDIEGDAAISVSATPASKRIRGSHQSSSSSQQNQDEQAISESSINKIVGAAEMYYLEEKAPPGTLMCELRPYQKQALYWMSEAEKGIDVERAANTLHPCWAAYRICDERVSSIYVNIFTGEATTQFPTAIRMARGGILADAMGLGKTVMTIALILSRPGRGSSENHSAGPRRARGGTLIICPMALLSQWKDELETHSQPGSIKLLVHYGGDRISDPMVILAYDVVLTTYGVLAAASKNNGRESIFHHVDWYRVVLDEAHTIKSSKTQVAQAAFALQSHCRWCLTGTPLQNNLEDLYSLLCFLRVEPWCNWSWWHRLIQRPYENGDYRGLKLVKAILRPLMLRRTKETKDKYGRPILVLPPTDIQIIECEHTEAEHGFYNALFKRSKVRFDEFVAQGKVLHNYANILELLLRLRQCCNHPFLVMSHADTQKYADLNRLARKFLEDSIPDKRKNAELSKIARKFLEDNNPDSTAINQIVPSKAYVEEVVEDLRRGEHTECPICYESSDDPILTPCAHRMCRECLLSCLGSSQSGLCPICRQVVNRTDLITCPTESPFQLDVEKNWRESSKVSKLLKCLEEIRRWGSGEKSIVFSQWTSFLDLLEIPLIRKNVGYLRYDGQLAQKQRERVLKEFNESNEKMVLLMSLRAGGVGLNLTAASNVFLMDPWWNPAVEEQAIMRIHRIGQKRTVNVRRFIVKDTVEERLQQVQARKQRMIAGALTDEEVRSARIEELKMLFR